MITSWKKLGKHTVFHKYSVQIDEVRFKMPDGKERDFYLKEDGPAVAILALTPEKEVILVDQYRPGPDAILSELPGGFTDSGETPVEAGRRELVEETGYSGTFQNVTDCFDGAYTTMVRTALVATDCEPVDTQHLDDSEYAEVRTVSLDEFRDLLRSGNMTDVEIGYLALDSLGLL
jgi:ADP-ribose pyrophosphatase